MENINIGFWKCFICIYFCIFLIYQLSVVCQLYTHVFSFKKVWRKSALGELSEIDYYTL